MPSTRFTDTNLKTLSADKTTWFGAPMRSKWWRSMSSCSGL